MAGSSSASSAAWYAANVGNTLGNSYANAAEAAQANANYNAGGPGLSNPQIVAQNQARIAEAYSQPRDDLSVAPSAAFLAIQSQYNAEHYASVGSGGTTYNLQYQANQPIQNPTSAAEIAYNVSLHGGVVGAELAAKADTEFAPYGITLPSSMVSTARDTGNVVTAPVRSVSMPNEIAADLAGTPGKFVTTYMPVGNYSQVAVKGTKDVIDQTTGEIGVYQQMYDPNTGKLLPYLNLVGGGGRNALQSGAFSIDQPLTSSVIQQAGLGGFTPATIAQQLSTSRLGAEAYGGFSTALDNRTFGNAKLSTYADQYNLARYVNPQGPNMSKTAAPGAYLPWGLDFNASTINFAGPQGLLGTFVNPEGNSPAQIATAAAAPLSRDVTYNITGLQPLGGRTAQGPQGSAGSLGGSTTPATIAAAAAVSGGSPAAVAANASSGGGFFGGLRNFLTTPILTSVESGAAGIAGAVAAGFAGDFALMSGRAPGRTALPPGISSAPITAASLQPPKGINFIGFGGGFQNLGGSRGGILRETTTVTTPATPDTQTPIDIALNTASGVANELAGFAQINLGLDTTRGLGRGAGTTVTDTYTLPTPFVANAPKGGSSSVVTPTATGYSVTTTTTPAYKPGTVQIVQSTTTQGQQEKTAYQALNEALAGRLDPLSMPAAYQAQVAANKSPLGYVLNLGMGAYEGALKNPLGIAKAVSEGVIIAAGADVIGGAAATYLGGTRLAPLVSFVGRAAPYVFTGAMGLSGVEQATQGFRDFSPAAASRLGTIASTQWAGFFAGAGAYGLSGGRAVPVEETIQNLGTPKGGYTGEAAFEARQGSSLGGKGVPESPAVKALRMEALAEEARDNMVENPTVPQPPPGKPTPAVGDVFSRTSAYRTAVSVTDITAGSRAEAAAGWQMRDMRVQGIGLDAGVAEPVSARASVLEGAGPALSESIGEARSPSDTVASIKSAADIAKDAERQKAIDDSWSLKYQRGRSVSSDILNAKGDEGMRLQYQKGKGVGAGESDMASRYADMQARRNAAFAAADTSRASAYRITTEARGSASVPDFVKSPAFDVSRMADLSKIDVTSGGKTAAEMAVTPTGEVARTGGMPTLEDIGVTTELPRETARTTAERAGVNPDDVMRAKYNRGRSLASRGEAGPNADDLMLSRATKGKATVVVEDSMAKAYRESQARRAAAMGEADMARANAYRIGRSGTAIKATDFSSSPAFNAARMGRLPEAVGSINLETSAARQALGTDLMKGRYEVGRSLASRVAEISDADEEVASSAGSGVREISLEKELGGIEQTRELSEFEVRAAEREAAAKEYEAQRQAFEQYDRQKQKESEQAALELATESQKTSEITKPEATLEKGGVESLGIIVGEKAIESVSEKSTQQILETVSETTSESIKERGTEVQRETAGETLLQRVGEVNTTRETEQQKQSVVERVGEVGLETVIGTEIGTEIDREITSQIEVNTVVETTSETQNTREIETQITNPPPITPVVPLGFPGSPAQGTAGNTGGERKRYRSFMEQFLVGEGIEFSAFAGGLDAAIGPAPVISATGGIASPGTLYTRMAGTARGVIAAMRSPRTSSAAGGLRAAASDYTAGMSTPADVAAGASSASAAAIARGVGRRRPAAAGSPAALTAITPSGEIVPFPTSPVQPMQAPNIYTVGQDYVAPEAGAIIPVSGQELAARTAASTFGTATPVRMSASERASAITVTPEKVALSAAASASAVAIAGSVKPVEIAGVTPAAEIAGPATPARLVQQLQLAPGPQGVEAIPAIQKWTGEDTQFTYGTISSSHNPVDIVARDIAMDLGKAGLPRIVSRDVFEKTPSMTLSRGVKMPGYVDQYFTRDYDVRPGAYGVGNYFAYDLESWRGTPGENTGLDVAKVYGNYTFQAKLVPGAKVAKYSELQAQIETEKAEASQPANAGTVRKRIIDIIGIDEGRYALAHGYDAIDVDDGSGFMVVLNRAATVAAVPDSPSAAILAQYVKQGGATKTELGRPIPLPGVAVDVVPQGPRMLTAGQQAVALLGAAPEAAPVTTRSQIMTITGGKPVDEGELFRRSIEVPTAHGIALEASRVITEWGIRKHAESPYEWHGTFGVSGNDVSLLTENTSNQVGSVLPLWGKIQTLSYEYKMTHPDAKIVDVHTHRTDVPLWDSYIADINKGRPEDQRQAHTRLTWMSPDRYIQKQKEIFAQRAKEINAHHSEDEFITADKMFYRMLEPEKVNQLKKDMMAGSRFDALAIEYDRTGKIKDFQEGRHRAVAAKGLNAEAIPVWEIYEKESGADARQVPKTANRRGYFLNTEALPKIAAMPSYSIGQKPVTKSSHLYREPSKEPVLRTFSVLPAKGMRFKSNLKF